MEYEEQDMSKPKREKGKQWRETREVNWSIAPMESIKKDVLVGSGGGIPAQSFQ
jgi:hypothetical protein